MRNRYWNIGPFADWLRGTPSPGAETSKGWREWTARAKSAHPIRYWFVEEGLRYIQNFIMWPIDRLYDVKYYINNRFVTRTHCLTAHPRDIKPGTWYDVGNRFLPCLFNELVDFVEIELAWWEIAWNEEGRKKFKSPWYATGWFRWRTWRSREAGLANLAWQKTCDNKDYTPEDDPRYGELTHQAHAAKEIEALYLWWTEGRPKRPDPMDASGWSKYCEERWEKDQSILDQFDDDAPGKVDTRPMLDMMNDMEAKYEQEDEEMMIRLIKIRQSLWT